MAVASKKRRTIARQAAPKVKKAIAAKKRQIVAKASKNQEPVARFDHAQTTDQNYRHWANADSLGPVLSLDPYVRKTVRERCRYEVANDPHLCGLVETMALDTIGSGPRLQLQSTAPAEDVRKVENLFASWCRKTKYAEALRLMVRSRRVDGEVFALHNRDETLNHPVKLRFSPFEADLVSEPAGGMNREGDWDDGIEYDATGRPTRYLILDSHPGDGVWAISSAFTTVEASLVMHYFKPTRPGQRRGMSEFVSALGTIAQLRRYGNATLSAAEFAASISGTMETDGSPEDGPVAAIANETFRLYQNMALTLPAGWKLNQLRPEQPTSTYKEFSSDKRSEMGRPVGAPFNVISGNSSGYNYSSGRLDHVPYQRNAWIERDDLEIAVVDHTIAAFLRDAEPLGLIPPSLGPVEELTWECQWDGFNSIDPYKDAQASQLRLQIGLTTLSEECAAEGRNYRDVLEQQAIEQELRRELGLTSPTDAPNDQTVPGEVFDEEGNLIEVPASDLSVSTASGAKKTVAAGSDVQSTALNGAQIASLVAVCDKIPIKAYPADASEALIQAAFPLMDRKLISTIVKSLAKHTPPPPPKPETGDEDDTALDRPSRREAVRVPA